MTHAAPALRLEALLWPPLERRHPHAHLGPLAAFFDLCEARYDRPMLFHMPPPLVPMVHCARVPAELALRELTTFTRTHGHVPPSDIDASEVPLSGLQAYVDLVGTADDDEAVLVGLTLLGKLASTDGGAAAVASRAVLLPVCEVMLRVVPASRDTAPPLPYGIATTAPSVRSTSTQVATASCDLLRFFAYVATQDFVLWSRGVEAVAAVALHFTDDPATLSVATRTMHVLHAKRPPYTAHLLQSMMRALAALSRHPDRAVRLDALSLLVTITDSSLESIQLALPLVPEVVDLLKRTELTDEEQLMAALRVVGNIATGNDIQTDSLVASGVFESFHVLVTHPNETIRKEACWILTNMLVGSDRQIQAVIDAGLIPPLLDIIRHDTDDDVVAKAVHAIVNLTNCSQPEQMAVITTTEALSVLLHRLMSLTDERMQADVLAALQNCFYADSASVDRYRAIEGSVAHLRELHGSSHDAAVCKSVRSMLEKFFGDCDLGNGEDEGEAGF